MPDPSLILTLNLTVDLDLEQSVILTSLNLTLTLALTLNTLIRTLQNPNLDTGPYADQQPSKTRFLTLTLKPRTPKILTPPKLDSNANLILS